MAQHWTQRSYDLEPYKTVVRKNPAELIFRMFGLNGTGFLAAYLFAHIFRAEMGAKANAPPEIVSEYQRWCQEHLR